MNIDMNDRAAVERRLWDEIEKHDTGMLGVVGGAAHHTQPMTAFPEPERGQIWFFTRTDTDLAKAVAQGGGAGEGGEAMFVVQAKDQGFQACVGGHLSQRFDPKRMTDYWGPVVAAWYPEGKDDPRLTLIRMRCEDAQVWIVEAGPVRFGWEIAKSNASHERPDLGSQTRLDLH